MRNFRNGMVWKKTMSREMLLMFPTHCHKFFFSLKNKNSYFEWCILRSQSVQLSCWIRAIQDHFSDRNRFNRSKPRGRDLSDVVPLSFNQGLSQWRLKSVSRITLYFFSFEILLQMYWRYPRFSSSAVSLAALHYMEAVCALWSVFGWKWRRWWLFLAPYSFLSTSRLCPLYSIRSWSAIKVWTDYQG